MSKDGLCAIVTGSASGLGAATAAILAKGGARIVVNYSNSKAEAEATAVRHGFSRNQIIKAWTPWLILSVLVFLWGLPQIKDWLNALSSRMIASCRASGIWLAR